MSDFKAVRSGLDISKYLKEYLVMCDPVKYPLEDGAKIVRGLNDILQGRSEHTVAEMLAGIDAVCGRLGIYNSEWLLFRRDIDDFLHQKELLTQPYTSKGVGHYTFKTHNNLKIIDQRLYDQAVKDGFPIDFFRQSYFDHVKFYCLPDKTDYSFSYFNNCTFAVCRIRKAIFDGTTFSSSEFHSCAMQYVTFFQASIDHTHFHDSTLQNVSFQKAWMKSCHTIDCDLENISFLHTTLDGCSFGRVNAHGTSNLHTATITQGGATNEEVEQNRKAIFSALRPGKEKQRVPPAMGRDGR